MKFSSVPESHKETRSGLVWCVGHAFTLRRIDSSRRWSKGLLDACIAMIPKAEGESTPIGQCPLCVLSVVDRFWASVKSSHLQQWCYSWVDFYRRIPSSSKSGGLQICVVDVVKHFRTTIRDLLECALGRLGLPAQFRKVHFSFLNEVRLRLKMAAGLGVAWAKDGKRPSGMLLSVVGIVAL